jgi:anthranilate/para-aminobenzoate synthase component I
MDSLSFYTFKGALYSRETFVHDKSMERDLFTLQRKLESSSSEVITESSRDPLSLYPFKGTLYSRETFVHDKAMERDLFTLRTKLGS